VADNFVASSAIVYQQIWGKVLTLKKASSILPRAFSQPILAKLLAAKGLKAEEDAMYLYKAYEETIWPYDDQGRLDAEDVWKPDPEEAEIIKLDRTDVLTTQ
jgi:hypothetical protein